MSEQEIDFEGPQQNKLRLKRKSESGNRIVQHSWTADEVKALITAVEKRPRLWDAGSAEYKLGKLDFWREVVDEIGLDVTVKEAKCKWGCLRVTFKANLAKLRTKKSGQGAETSSVHWQFFNQMMFLEANDVKRSTSSVSSMDHDFAALVDDAVANDVPITETVVGQPQQRKRRFVTKALTSPSTSTSPLPSCSTTARLAILNSAVSALQASDKNSTFCDYLLSHLRTLPEDQADNLRNGMNRYLLEFLEENSRSSSVQLVRFVEDVEDEVDVDALEPIIVHNDEDERPSAFFEPSTGCRTCSSTEELDEELLDV